jgi:hypothetical protein
MPWSPVCGSQSGFALHRGELRSGGRQGARRGCVRDLFGRRAAPTLTRQHVDRVVHRCAAERVTKTERPLRGLCVAFCRRRRGGRGARAVRGRQRRSEGRPGGRRCGRGPGRKSIRRPVETQRPTRVEDRPLVEWIFVCLLRSVGLASLDLSREAAGLARSLLRHRSRIGVRSSSVKVDRRKKRVHRFRLRWPGMGSQG